MGALDLPPVVGPLLDSHPDRNLGIASDLPIVMLPVRVETRWFVLGATHLELRIRIFPDDLHLAQQHPIGAGEYEDTVAYWRHRLTDGETSETAERARQRLVQRTGQSRAAHLIRTLAPTGEVFPPAPTTASNLTPIVARALPARWVAIGRIGARSVFEVSGVAVPAQLPVVPLTGAPDSDTALPLEARWLHDFAAAETVGMALRVTVSQADAHALDELVVIGIPSTDSTRDAATLGELFAAHAANAASLIEPGTPTNRVAAGTIAVARATGTPPGAGSDGHELARALGIDPVAFQDIAGATVATDRWQRAMNTALWPSTWGYYLDIQIGALDEATIRAGRSHFINHVRPAGPLPALRLGAQPYGVLPVCAWRSWPSANVADAWLANFLRERARELHARTSSIPRVVGAGDVDGTFERILATPPCSTGVLARLVHAPDAIEATSASGWLGIDNVQDYLDQIENALDAAPWLAAGFPATPQLHAMIYDDTALDVRAAVIGPSASYLTSLADASIEDLVAHRIPGTPRSLLYVLARAAVLHAEVSVADAVLATPLAVRRGRIAGDGVVSRLARARTAGLSHTLIEVSERNHVRAALRLLAAAPVRVLEHATMMVLDAASHRLDAWLTSLATKRLAAVRATQSRSVIGGWCWLERPRPRLPVTDLAVAAPGAGYLHAPSLGQARTAAILRAGYQIHRDDLQTDAVQLDLSSRRVRVAREFLDGVRAGQPLGVVLGYRIERMLHDAHADRWIDDLRAAFPRDDEGGVVTHVVDGWKAHETWRVTSPSEPELRAVAKQLADDVDAVADLLLAEAVHHTARGNPIRAGAALGNLDRGDGPIVEPQLAATPSAGRPRTSRVVLALPDQGGWLGDDQRARSVAAPALARWAATVLGRPEVLQAVIRTVDRTLTWNVLELDLCALDIVAWCENDGAPLRELCAAIASRVLGATATVELGPGFVAAIARASTIQRLLRDARPATPRDVGGTEARPVLAEASGALANVLGELATGARVGALFALVGAANGDGVAALAKLRERSAENLAVAILGDGVPRVGTIVAWPPPSVTLTTATERATWLAEYGRVRPALDALDLLALIAPESVGSGAAFATDSGDLLVFGSEPHPGCEAIVIDAFTISPAATELSTGVAVHQESPRARAPQSILVAVTPPSVNWTLDVLEATVLDTIELARLRMLEPHQVHDHYLPALHLAEELDAETIGTNLFDLDVVDTIRVLE